MGIGDWGLGIGDKEKRIGTNHQSPKPNPQSQNPKIIHQMIYLKLIIKKNKHYIRKKK